MKKIIFFILICLCGCTAPQTRTFNHLNSDSTLNTIHAEGFAIAYHNSFKEVAVFNPWKKGEIMEKYYLVDNPNTSTPDDGIKLQVPLQSISTTSCTHIQFLDQINSIESVKGVCTSHLIYNPKITNNPNITDIGDAFNINLERLLMLRTNAIMLSSYNQQDETANRLKQSGIPVIYNNEWTESSPLARAEWIKFVAAFYNKEQLADSIFNHINSEYAKYSTMTDSIHNKPTILVGGNFKGTWYIPGGKSYMGKLLADAGANYLYKNDPTEQSIPLNFETILLNFKDADIWLNAPTSSMQQLYAMDEKHRLFSSAKNNKVYSFYNRINTNGANDFWESAVTLPHIVLQDMIWALHPQLMPNHTPTYIMHLK